MSKQKKKKAVPARRKEDTIQIGDPVLVLPMLSTSPDEDRRRGRVITNTSDSRFVRVLLANGALMDLYPDEIQKIAWTRYDNITDVIPALREIRRKLDSALNLREDQIHDEIKAILEDDVTPLTESCILSVERKGM